MTIVHIVHTWRAAVAVLALIGSEPDIQVYGVLIPNTLFIAVWQKENGKKQKNYPIVLEMNSDYNPIYHKV